MNRNATCAQGGINCFDVSYIGTIENCLDVNGREYRGSGRRKDKDFLWFGRRGVRPLLRIALSVTFWSYCLQYVYYTTNAEDSRLSSSLSTLALERHDRALFLSEVLHWSFRRCFFGVSLCFCFHYRARAFIGALSSSPTANLASMSLWCFFLRLLS
jgi:hypothetical protein